MAKKLRLVYCDSGSRRVIKIAAEKQLDPPQLIGRTLLGGHEHPIQKFSGLLPTPDTPGDFEEMCLAAGESAGLVGEFKPAGEIVREMMDEAEQIITGRLAVLVG
jgi:hypothetical protein